MDFRNVGNSTEVKSNTIIILKYWIFLYWNYKWKQYQCPYDIGSAVWWQWWNLGVEKWNLEFNGTQYGNFQIGSSER